MDRFEILNSSRANVMYMFTFNTYDPRKLFYDRSGRRTDVNFTIYATSCRWSCQALPVPPEIESSRRGNFNFGTEGRHCDTGLCELEFVLSIKTTGKRRLITDWPLNAESENFPLKSQEILKMQYVPEDG